MKRRALLASGMILMLGFSICGALNAQPSAQDQQKAMEAYMKQMAVTENHAYLKQLVGKWDVKTSMWTFPGTPPTVSQGIYDCALIFGGRFLMMKFTGTMMGQPFEGLQIAGYDNMKKKHIAFWIDNTSTAFYLTTGTLDASKKIMTETGEWPDPMTGGTSHVRAVTKWIGPDEFVYEMYMVEREGKEFKSMEMQAVRKK